MDGRVKSQADTLRIGGDQQPLGSQDIIAVPGLDSFPRRGSRSYNVSKRIFDTVVSALALIFAAPLFLAIAVLIKVRYPDTPVFVSVEAVGRKRRTFPMWKFSTMVRDAHLIQETMLRENPALAEEWKRTVKLRNDPRVLPGLGYFLRRTSLNELPQLYNVLVGEMSLVGPRPITKREEALYIEFGGVEILQQRYSVRPGITGLWQTSGRSGVAYSERIVYDRAYLANPSFLADLRIILKTIADIVFVRHAGV